MDNLVFLIGIAGGTGSGKTTIARAISSGFEPSDVVLIEQDSYYNDLSELNMTQRSENNFDHPASIEFDLLYNHLLKIKENKPVNMPIYNYKTHTRRKKSNLINQKYSLILLEGILSLYDKKIRKIMSHSVFIDVPNKLRKERRIIRDAKNRDRTVESIINQYNNMVVPMFEKYVKPMKKKSDIIIKKFDQNDVGYSKLIKEIQKITNDKN